MDDGIFWTMPVPKTSVKIKPGRGDALFTLSDVSLLDYFTSVNAILRPPELIPLDASASIEVHWTATGERLQIDNDQAGFGGQYENASATVEWSASNSEGYFFSTINSSHTNVTHAFTAHMRNGIFFPA